MIQIEVVNQLADLSEAGELIKRSYVYTPAGQMPSLISRNVEHIIEVEKIKYLINLIDSSKFYILAKDNIKLIGFGIISESNLQYFYDLTWVCVDPEYRNQGLGKRITAKAVEFAESRERTVIITTEIPRFYTELGFTVLASHRPGLFLMTSTKATK
jgi:ribosomal protein S18 acetylase RimI-like enzyme